MHLANLFCDVLLKSWQLSTHLDAQSAIYAVVEEIRVPQQISRNRGWEGMSVSVIHAYELIRKINDETEKHEKCTIFNNIVPTQTLLKMLQNLVGLFVKVIYST